MTTEKLELTELANGQQNGLNANETFGQLNQLVQALVLDKDLSAPPGSPANEALYIVGATATGAWAGEENSLAYWLTAKGVWTFIPPKNGFLVKVADESSYYEFNGTAWSVFSGGGGGGMTNPMTTAADIIVGGASGTPARLGKGTALQVLRVNAAGTALEYADPSGGGGGMTNPMTTAGDIIVGGASGTPARLGIGSDGQVLTLVSGALAWAAPTGGGSLTNFTESYNTASPNNIIAAAMLLAAGGSTNIDAVYAAKGTGSTLAQLADNSTTGGNKRGTRTTDFQKARAAADQVASGAGATIAGGENNKASGSYSFSSGYANSSTGTYSVTLGQNNTASGNSALSSGAYCTAGGDYSYSHGQNCVADSAYSRAKGLRALVRGVYGAEAWATKNIFSDGDSQVRRLILARRTSNATPVVITSDNGTASASNQINIPIRSSFLIKGRVSAHNQSTNDASAWEFTALMKSTTGGTVSLVGTPTATVIAQDAGAASWDVTLGSNNTTKTFTVTVTGAASGVTQWTCLLECVESTT